jgi:pseudaminic acid synthase
MPFTINNRSIGPNEPPYIVAELSANHNGSIERAKRSIDAAKTCGADAIKIQTYTAETITIDCEKQDFIIKDGLWEGSKLYDLYKSAETPFEWHEELFRYARNCGITIFSTPFDETAVDLLESLGTPAYKIASFEIVDLPLIRYVATKGKPMIISTGIASEIEIAEAVSAAREAGCENLALLHCISSYPAPIDHANLVQMNALADRFNTLVGLSDHTLGTTASIVAIALGACIIEKHFTIDRRDPGPDSAFSIDCNDLSRLSREAKEAWLAIGKKSFERQKSEKTSAIFRRSLYFVKNLSAGHVVSEGDIRRIRPGFGLAPKFYGTIIGRKLKKDVFFGQSVQNECFES